MPSSYLQYMQLMSIWEAGHRWAGYGPDATDEGNLPEPVREKLRALLQAANMSLNLFDKSGREQLDLYVPFIGIVIPNKATTRAKELLNTRQFPKEDLDSFFIYKDEVEKWCLITGQNLPPFWFSEDEIEYHDEQLKRIHGNVEPTGNAPKPFPKLRPEQEDKILVQEAASRLWKTPPFLTITAMMKRDEILIEANGKTYKPKTLRSWLSEVAPPEVKKPGRPRKN